MTTRAAHRGATRPLLAVSCALALVVSLLGWVNPGPAAAAVAPTLTFSATVRSSGLEAIFTANADGSNVVQVSPDDGRSYSWGRFAFGNTKIIYTVRTGAFGAPEDIGLMNLDGSAPRVLRRFEYSVKQPLVDPTGRWVTYSADAPFYPKHALFRLDLKTNVVSDLTSVGRTKGTYDADPFLNAKGDRIYFVEDVSGRGTTINQMDVDGSDRAALTSSTYFSTDPSVSPDGKTLAISSYRGYGLPPQSDEPDEPGVLPPEYFYISLQPTKKGGEEKLLSGGRNCVHRTLANPCTVAEMSAWQPRFLPGGASVSFIGALDGRRTCVCAIGIDGTGGRIVVARMDLAINWQDWSQPAGYSTSTAAIGTAQRTSSLLLVMAGKNKVKRLVIASPDLANRTVVPLPTTLEPLDATWGPGLTTILFTAKVPVGTPRAPNPAAPAGKKRVVHPKHSKPKKLAASVAQQQVFSFDTTTGRTTQLTNPWIEDWRDGLAAGDARSNTQPDVSPDGRYVTVTNTSTKTGESFLLQISLTGAVLNLTHATKESAPSDDADPAYSPDGKHLAFTRIVGKTRAVYVMDAPTGLKVRALRTDKTAASAPAWAPDGKSLLYVSTRGKGSVVVRSTITGGGTKAGKPSTVSGTLKTATAPVISSENDRIALLYKSKVYARASTGTGAPKVVQPDLVNTVTALDWGRR